MKFSERWTIPPVLAVLLAIISVQGGAAIAKGLFPILGPTTTATLRIGLSAIILLVAYRPDFRKISRLQWQAVIPYGLTLGAMNIIFYMAIKRVPLGLGVALEFVGPLLLAIYGSRRAIDYFWVLLAAGGIALISPWSANGVDLLGVVLALTAGGFWAAYIVLGGRISKLMPDGEAVAVGMVFATMLVLPFGVSSGGFPKITPQLFLAGTALALLSSAIPFTLEMSALRRIPMRTFSILMSMEPAAAAICGIIFLKEHLSFYEYTAIVMIIIASAGAAMSAKSNKLHGTD